MNKYIIAAVIILLVLVGGVYFYQQKYSRAPGQMEGASSNRPIAQSHRSYFLDIIGETPSDQSFSADKVSGKPVNFKFTIKNDLGEILKDFETVHEKKMHFIVVREDLQNFQHLHPLFNEKSGEWTVEVTFPEDGFYRIFPDFTPAKSADNPMLLPVTVNARVKVGDSRNFQPKDIKPDTQKTKISDGYQITYSFPAKIEKQSEITYKLNVSKNNQPITNLEKYLGALGHSVILKEDTLDFIHAHAGEAMDMSMPGMDPGTSGMSLGPDIEFRAFFPESGLYKIFTQFQHQGKVITTDYTVEVN